MAWILPLDVTRSSIYIGQQMVWISMTKKAKIPLVLTTLILLTGCATTPPPASVALQSFQQFDARRLDDPGLKSFIVANTGVPVLIWPPRAWNFDQLNLAAFYYSPDLDVARAQWEAVKATEITAGQIPNPTVGFSPTWDETNFYHLFLPFDFNLPIETADKRQLRITGATDQARAAQYKIIATAWTIRNRLVNALIDDYAANRSITLYRRHEAAQKPIVALFEQRQASGQSLSLNASQLLVSYQQTLLAEKQAEIRRAEAEADLAAALGVPLDAVAAIDIAWKNFAMIGKNENARAAHVPAMTLKHNAQLRAALADYVAAHAALQLELAKRIPDINIGPGYDWSRNGPIYTFGLSLTLPVFNDNEGPIAEAAAKRKEAAERFNALQADIIGTIERTQAGYGAAYGKLKRAAQLLDAEQDKYERLSRQLGGGAVARLPLLLAKSEIQTAAIARLDAQVQVLKAKAALEYALEQPLFGGTVNSDLATSNPRGKP